MLSASTSMPCASIAAMRVLVSCISRPGASSGWLITAAAAGTMQWACTSMVLTRLPLTTTSRRRVWGFGVDETLAIAQGMNARPARVLVSRSPTTDISLFSFVHWQGLRERPSRAPVSRMLRCK